LEYLNENLVDYIFDALETAKKTQSMLPNLPTNTKPVHIRVLSAIYKIRDDNGCARITDINKTLQFSLPNTTKYINELHNLGLVEKTTLPSDMRVVLIHTTELGEQYIEKYVTTYHNRLQEEFEKIGESDCIIMIETINKVYSAVKKVYQE
jgi:DNA-binding MarR family transcriptional regulator